MPSRAHPAFTRVETYYMGDPASQDLATAVHRHLMRNLDRRGTGAPAITCLEHGRDRHSGRIELLTHPPVDDRPKLTRRNLAEALSRHRTTAGALAAVTSAAPAD
jgi:hypothetical protein